MEEWVHGHNGCIKHLAEQPLETSACDESLSLPIDSSQFEKSTDIRCDESLIEGIDADKW